MTRFTIFRKNLTPLEIEALEALVGEVKGPDDEVSVVDVLEDADPEFDEVVIVLGTPATCADADLDGDLRKIANGARRAIWVWPQGCEAAVFPPPAAKYSYSAIPWNSGKLRAAAADDDVTCFETPTGAPIPKVPTKRNLCVEEKNKAA